MTVHKGFACTVITLFSYDSLEGTPEHFLWFGESGDCYAIGDDPMECRRNVTEAICQPKLEED